jgi:phospholipid/cholesterol/gamma-HCH transport system substrate-binding protein
VRRAVRDIALVLALVATSFATLLVILANQRVDVPGWVPVVGADAFELETELRTAQAVTPGQGQTVNVAGVRIGEIAGVRLERGRAIVRMRLDEGQDRVYRDARVLLRPKTGLKDMVLELTPGTPRAGRLPEGGRIPIAQTLPDVNVDEILGVLDADTRAYLRILLAGAAGGLRGNGRALADGLRRFEPVARDLRRVNEALAERRANLKRVVRNLSLLTGELGSRDAALAGLVENGDAVFSILARRDDELRATLRELPGTLAATRSALGEAGALGEELGPALSALRPAARALAPALRATRPFLRETVPVLRDELRPLARDARPTARALRPALDDLAAASPDLDRSLAVVNRLLNALGYNPVGREEGYLFYLAWANHLSATLFGVQDAHGPIRRGVVLLSCANLAVLESVAAANPQLGTLVGLLNPPDRTRFCR